MHLPDIAPGKRFALPRPPGSADALLLARFAEREQRARPARRDLHRRARRRAAPGRRDRRSSRRALRCALFPDWETLPYDSFSPHQDLISERLATLWRICAATSTSCWCRRPRRCTRLAPPSFLAGYTFHFTAKQRLDEAALKAQLTLAGYTHVSQVVSPGEYAVRGGLIDLFPMGSAVPYRVDLFDDEIDSIRTFDPDTPAQPLPGARSAAAARARVPDGRGGAQRASARAGASARRRPDQEPHLQGHRRRHRHRRHRVLPAAVLRRRRRRSSTTSAPTRRWCCTASSTRRCSASGPTRASAIASCSTTASGPILPPEALFLTRRGVLRARASAHAQLALRGDERRTPTPWATALPDLSVDRGAAEPLARLQDHVAATPHRVLIVAESEGRRESLLELLRDSRIDPPSVATLAEFEAGDERFAIAAAPLAQGFAWRRADADERTIEFVTETELFATAPGARRRRTKQEQVSDVNALIKDLSELKVGDPVVHVNHGIGRYLGLTTSTLGGDEASAGRVPAPRVRRQGDALRAGRAAAPDQPLHRRQRRGGAAAQARLGPVGQGAPQGRRAGARHRRRAAQPLRPPRRARGLRVPLLSRTTTRRSPTSFGFEETADQHAAIHAVIQDMVSPQPMDRLVCGDVGFGKTEVALRAAFVAVTGGKQVAILAPTTLLAEQHYQTHRRPLRQVAGQGGRAVALPLGQGSQGDARRARPTARSTSSSARTSCSRPTSSSSAWACSIIDEEHRFGVRHKEQMKALRAEVDVLTLTATPIPRTLGMALEGLRDLSVIATAPQRRLAIKTFVRNEGIEHDPRGGAARAQARRPGLLPAQRGARRSRTGARRLQALRARGAHRRRARPDARARARARDARLRRPALQRAALLDDHRDRHRRADAPTRSSSAAPTSSAWRSCTSCAAASAARTTRPTPT